MRRERGLMLNWGALGRDEDEEGEEEEKVGPV